jgi:hypothetical protein
MIAQDTVNPTTRKVVIPGLYDENGGEELSLSTMTSYMFWKNILDGKIPDYDWIPDLLKTNGFKWGDSLDSWMKAQENIWKHPGICGFCDNAGARRDDKYGYYWCMCRLLALPREFARMYAWAGSQYEKRYLSEYKDLDTASARWTKSARLDTQAFMNEPKQWMVYSGPPGVGKTHLMHALATHFGMWALYITANDFEGKLRGMLDKSDTDGHTIEQFMVALQSYPILLFDDLGIEYSSPWIAAKLDSLIEARYRYFWDRITVFATNIKDKDIHLKLSRDGITRSASRLTSINVLWVSIQAADARGKNIR